MSMDPGTSLEPIGQAGNTVDTSVKPGYLTTEWWTTILTVVAGLVISALSLYGKNLDGSKLQPLIGAVAVLASGIAAGFYNHSRGTVKAAALHAAAVNASGAYQITSLGQPIFAEPIQQQALPAPPAPPVQDGPPMAEDTGVGN